MAHFQGDAVPAFLAAFQNTNPVVRANAASIFNRGYGEIFDSRLADAAVAWLKDSEPEIRMTAVTILTEYSNWKPKYAVPIIAMLRDKDSGVRHAVVFALPRFRGDLEKHIPAIQRMLKDPDANARAASLEIINRLGIEAEMSRADLLSLFASSDFLVLDAANTQLGGRQGEISGDEALVMLQSQQIVARLLGLHALNQKLEKKSVELALPLLRDTDEMVRLTAAQTLRSLTGQKFSEDQPDEWTKWWLKNKTNFVVQPHPEELRPERFRRSVFGGDDDTPPPSVPK